MYLDGRLDATVVASAGEEIAVSPEFARLSAELTHHLQGLADGHHLTASDVAKIRSAADAHVKAVKKRKGIAFRVRWRRSEDFRET